MTNLLTSATPANQPKYKTAAAPTFTIYDVNSITTDVSIGNPMVAMTNMALKDLASSATSTCNTNGFRTFVPL